MILTSHTISRGQTTLDGFVVRVEKALPVTKASLKEFCLELIVDADLVSLSSCFWDGIKLSLFQSFHFVDRPSFRRLLLYTCPKLTDSDILKKSCIANAVMEKLSTLDEIDKKLIAVCVYLHIVFNPNFETEYFVSDFNCHRWVVHKRPSLILLVQHSVYPFTT